jgi:uncharacterized membrane protein SirB2
MYLALKFLHVSCVVLSLAGFVLRGIWRMKDSPLGNARLSRVLPHLIDTTLLLSAVSLAFLARQYPFVNAWLSAKLLGLVVYIGLGTVALGEAGSRARRGVAFALALVTYSYIVSVALSKDPWGWFALL